MTDESTSTNGQMAWIVDRCKINQEVEVDGLMGWRWGIVSCVLRVVCHPACRIPRDYSLETRQRYSLIVSEFDYVVI